MPVFISRLQLRYFLITGIPTAALLLMLLFNINAGNDTIEWTLADGLFFVGLFFLLWIITRYVQQWLQNRLTEFRYLLLRQLLLFLTVLIISFFCSFIAMYAWNNFKHEGSISNSTLFSLQLLTVLILQLLLNFYEIALLQQERETDIIKIERTERSKIQAQLDSLKNQVDPHFIFNSLNTLSYLISQDPPSARLFNDMLGKVYRYILVKKEKDLVPLKEEIEFASNYFYLLQIRYQTGLFLSITIAEEIQAQYMLPPLSIQTLIENAIKHNHFTDKKPLHIRVGLVNNHITVTNNRSAKLFEMHSSKIGLKNLAERYQLVTGSQISIEQSADQFHVELPLLKT